jgi:hypothetical protein
MPRSGSGAVRSLTDLKNGAMSSSSNSYPEEGTLETERRVNFDPKIYAEIRARAGLSDTSPSTCDGEVSGGAIAATGGGANNVEGPSATPSARSPSPSLQDGEDKPPEALSFEDVMHYQKIIRILCETDRTMKEIKLPL